MKTGKTVLVTGLLSMSAAVLFSQAHLHYSGAVTRDLAVEAPVSGDLAPQVSPMTVNAGTKVADLPSYDVDIVVRDLARDLVRDARKELGLPDPGDTDAIILASLEVGYQPSPDRHEVFLKSRPALQLEGHATAMSSTLLVLDETTITLQGIRSPEPGSICVSGTGTSFDCGYWSWQALQTALEAYPVSCEAYMHFGRQGDGIGSCNFRMGDGSSVDVGEWMITAGVAFADRSRGETYLAEESKARAAGAGLWSGNPGL